MKKKSILLTISLFFLSITAVSVAGVSQGKDGKDYFILSCEAAYALAGNDVIIIENENDGSCTVITENNG